MSGERTETLIILGRDTEPHVSWPRELENSFPGPVSGSSTFGTVGRAYTLNTVCFFPD